MADISKITLPDNTTYNIKDKNARNFTNTPYYEQDEEALMFQLGDSYMTGEQDNQPYLFRAAGGSADIGNREYDKIIGGTVAWNQLVRDEASTNEVDFADIVTVDDAVEDAAAVKVAIEPVQDLHGYDHPWPAGGTKNKMPNAIPKTETINGITFKLDDFGVFTVTGTATSEAYCDFPIGFSFVIPDGDPKPKIAFNNTQGINSVTFKFFNNTSLVDSWALVPVNRVSEYIGMRGKTCNSYRITVSSGATVNMTLSPMIVENSVTDYTYIPYSNICPISGWDEVKVTRSSEATGYQALDYITIPQGAYINTGFTSNSETLEIRTKVQANNFSQYAPLYCNYINEGTNVMRMIWATGNRSFYCNTNSKAASAFLIYVDSSIEASGVLTISQSKNRVTINGNAFTSIKQAGTPNNTPIALGAAKVQSNSTLYGLKKLYYFDISDNGVTLLQLRPAKRLSDDAIGLYDLVSNTFIVSATDVECVAGNIIDDYYPHTTYTIEMPTEAGTVYGGELTVNEDGSGSLVVNRAIVDLGTLNWYTSNAEAKIYKCSPPNMKRIVEPPYANRQIGVICSAYPYSININISLNMDDKAWLRSSNNFFVRDTTYADVTAFKTAMSGVQLVYELAAPVTYQLTASQIRTLLGTNNVWADTGDLALTYTGTDEHLTLESGRKYLSRINGTDSMLLGSGQEITVEKGTNNVFDLTQMFGSTIADYIYSLEQATPGAGIAWFRKLFPKPYYEYNPGELMSVQAVAHKLVGFNAWDEEWQLGIINTTTGEEIDSSSNIRSKNYIHVIPGATYYFKLGTTDISNNVVFYDAEKNYVAASDEHVDDTFTVPENAHYMKFYMSTNYGSTYLSNICINLSGNGERDGEYEEYKMHSYPLDSSLILRGIPKLDANNQLYYDGDEYQADGTVTRRFKQIVLDGVNQKFTAPWGVVEGGYSVYKTIADISNLGRSLILSDKFVNAFIGYNYMPVWSVGGSSGANTTVTFKFPSTIASITDANNWLKTNNVTMIYPVATPITEFAEPYDNPQIVDPEGTEEYITTSIVFVGHETKY